MQYSANVWALIRDEKLPITPDNYLHDEMDGSYFETDITDFIKGHGILPTNNYPWRHKSW